MTIEIADRLIKLRKKYGYSQEELAAKLGLSRQAVSKWERAEASPDTDNLICLAKLYGISLDDLLSTDEDLDTIIKEQVKKDEEEKATEEKPEEEVKTEEDTKEEEKHDRVEIDDEGVHVHDKDGSEVHITSKGIRCYDKDGDKVKIKRISSIIGAVEGALFLLALVAYILLGTLLDMWHNAWVVVFVPEIISSLIRAINKRDARKFNMPFFATFTFFFVCMIYPGLDANLWHPMWVVFLAIPIYYILVGIIRKIIGFEDIDDIDIDVDTDIEVDVSSDKD